MVAELANPIPWANSLGWTCVGIAPSAFLAWLAWIAGYALLPSSAQLRFAWVGPTMFVSGVAAVVVALLALVMNVSVRRAEKRSVKHVLEYMDDIHKLHETAGAVRRGPEGLLREVRSRLWSRKPGDQPPDGG